jgi:hypothetical protein
VFGFRAFDADHSALWREAVLSYLPLSTNAEASAIFTFTPRLVETPVTSR